MGTPTPDQKYVKVPKKEKKTNSYRDFQAPDTSAGLKFEHLYPDARSEIGKSTQKRKENQFISGFPGSRYQCRAEIRALVPRRPIRNMKKYQKKKENQFISGLPGPRYQCRAEIRALVPRRPIRNMTKYPKKKRKPIHIGISRPPIPVQG